MMTLQEVLFKIFKWIILAERPLNLASLVLVGHYNSRGETEIIGIDNQKLHSQSNTKNFAN